MKRGQLSIEFFLIVSIIAVFALSLYTTGVAEIDKSSTVDDAVLAKSALDSLTSAVNIVALEGNGSTIKRELFVPKQSVCFLYNSTAKRFYCLITSNVTQVNYALDTLSNFTYGYKVVASNVTSVYCSPSIARGWVYVTANNIGAGVVNLSCVGLATQ